MTYIFYRLSEVNLKSAFITLIFYEKFQTAVLIIKIIIDKIDTNINKLSIFFSVPF